MYVATLSVNDTIRMVEPREIGMYISRVPKNKTGGYLGWGTVLLHDGYNEVYAEDFEPLKVS